MNLHSSGLQATNGIQGSGLEDLCPGKKVNDHVLKEMRAACKQSGLAGIEMIEGVVLADEGCTPQNVSENVVLKIQIDAYRVFQGLVTSQSKS